MDSGWCFAKVNNRLAEIFFERQKGKLVFLGHCYIKRVEYKTKRDQKWIDSDTQKYIFMFRNKEYTDRKTGKKFRLFPLK